MQTARVRRTSLHDALAPQQQRLPTSGRIRPGIKVLTKAAREQIHGADQIYADGVAAGASFDDIEASLKRANTKFTRRPLTPKNAPYFRVIQSDFTTPGAAQAIMDAYAEDRGDGPQLYSFPVVFPSDELDLIFREQFEAWNASELARWSEQDPSTGRLMCMRRVETAPDRSKRRRWGGRPTESIGECNPNACDNFAKGLCKHIGSLYFWVPGVNGVGLIELTFTSIYASLGAAEIIDLVRAGMGRVKGTFNGKPIFRISKTSENVSMMDWEKGKATRQQQYIIRLEADGLDMANVLAQQEMAALAPPAPANTKQLTGPDTDSAVPHGATAGSDAPPPSDPTGHAPVPASISGAPDSISIGQQGGTGANAAAHTSEAVEHLRTERLGLAKLLNWTPTDLMEWLTGNGYTKEDGHNPVKLAEQISTLQGHVDRMKQQAAPAAKESAAHTSDAEEGQGEMVTGNDPF